MSISVVVDDVAVLVDFQHGLEFGVGGRQRVTEMQFYAQVTLLYQMEAGTIALIRGQVKTEEGVAVPEVAASQTVPLVLPNRLRNWAGKVWRVSVVRPRTLRGS